MFHLSKSSLVKICKQKLVQYNLFLFVISKIIKVWIFHAHFMKIVAVFIGIENFILFSKFKWKILIILTSLFPENLKHSLTQILVVFSKTFLEIKIFGFFRIKEINMKNTLIIKVFNKKFLFVFYSNFCLQFLSFKKLLLDS